METSEPDRPGNFNLSSWHIARCIGWRTFDPFLAKFTLNSRLSGWGSPAPPVLLHAPVTFFQVGSVFVEFVSPPSHSYFRASHRSQTRTILKGKLFWIQCVILCNEVMMMMMMITVDNCGLQVGTVTTLKVAFPEWEFASIYLRTIVIGAKKKHQFYHI